MPQNGNTNINGTVESGDHSDDTMTLGRLSSSAPTQTLLQMSQPQQKDHTRYHTIKIPSDGSNKRGANKRHDSYIAERITSIKQLSSDSGRLGYFTFIALMTSFDISIIFTTMSEIGSEFHSAHLSTWIYYAYNISSLMIMSAAGGLSNVIGRKTLLIALTSLFLIGSVGSAYSRNFTQIIISRGVAGLGGGGLPLLTNVILHDTIPKEKLGSYLSYMTVMTTLGSLFGPPVGGFITDHFGWRCCFKINIVPLLFVIYVYVFHFKNHETFKHQKEEQAPRNKLETIDFGGIILLSLANVAFTCALSLGGTAYSWSNPLMISILAAVPALYTSFFIYEKRSAKHPLLSKKVLTDRNFIVSCFCMFLLGICTAGFLSTLPQFLMGVLQFSTADAGLWLMFKSTAGPIGSLIAGWYMRYSSRFSRGLFISIPMIIVSMMILYSWMGEKITLETGTLGIIMVSASFGATTIILTVAITSTISNEVAAAAMSMCLLARELGHLAGTTSSSWIIQYTLKTVLPERIDGPDADKLIEFIIKSIRKTPTLAPEIQEIVSEVLELAMQRVVCFIMCSSALMLLISLRMRNISLKK